MKRIKLIYFSGTGGTARFTALLEKELVCGNCETEVLPLEIKATEKTAGEGASGINTTDLIVLLFPVHAFDAPQPVYTWIKSLPGSNGLPVAVISVSAGGEYWVNRISRFLLLKGGYDLKKIEAQMTSAVPEPDKKLASGAYSSFRDYLQKEDA